MLEREPLPGERPNQAIGAALQPGPDLTELRAQAERARAGYKWQEAIERYTAALALAGDQPALCYDLLDGQAECRRMSGDFTAEVADLEAMAGLAGTLYDPARQAQVAGRLTSAYRLLNDLDRAGEAGEGGLALARAMGDPRGEAYCLVALARVHDSERN